MLFLIAAPVLASQAALEPSSWGAMAGLAGLALVGGNWLPDNRRHRVNRAVS